jgi:hypothetical protein
VEGSGNAGDNVSLDLGDCKTWGLAATSSIQQIPGKSRHKVVAADANDLVAILAGIAKTEGDSAAGNQLVRRSKNKLAFSRHFSDLQRKAK